MKDQKLHQKSATDGASNGAPFVTEDQWARLTRLALKKTESFFSPNDVAAINHFIHAAGGEVEAAQIEERRGAGYGFCKTR